VRVAIAGSSGSIGTQTLDVIANEPLTYNVVALAVQGSADVVIEQARKWQPEVVVVADDTARARVVDALPGVRVEKDLTAVVDVADIVINGVVGFAGLPITIETLRQGKTLGLANKESLIAAGPIVQPLRSVPGAVLVPVDSEHCAIHQCLRSSDFGIEEVSRLVLTASGGPFRGRSQESLQNVTVDDALAHPTWKMGPKITVDSSTLMNKGLEVIEAHELFGIDFDRIDVVVHPQSIVHSMVEFTDGSTIAQLSMPDMRLPIGYALGYPRRIRTSFGAINWTTVGHLDFSIPDTATFRCLSLAYEAGRRGGGAPAFLSAANEIAVEAFLEGTIKWTDIAACIASAMDSYEDVTPTTIEDVLAVDNNGRSALRRVLVS
jgi:1-deoxy-D-xylulose-5-phosphate reductoisomerase